MAKQIHYEIFRRRGAAGSWSLVEVREEREDALKFAQSLINGDAVGVKVIKETFNEETGDYLSLKVFEHGEVKAKTRGLHEDVPSSPCFKVDDLYSYHARKTIAQVLPDFLSRYKVTVTELGHRADLLERLEATGTALQHAIQRVAVAQAASGENQLTKIIRGLHELTTQAMHRVYRDHEKGRFVETMPGGFLPLAEKLAETPEGTYLLNGSLAYYLAKDAKGWDDKVARLMQLMAEAEGETPGAKLLFACVDNLISEVLNGAAGLREVIGDKETHGTALMALVKLFLGREPDESEGREGLVALTRQFGADRLPNARIAIAQRILTEIRSFKRLCPNSLEDEFKTLRQIANLLVRGIGKYLSHEDLISAFVLRSQRLITAETLAPYLTGIPPDTKLERILFVEENIIGAENKRRLADFVAPVITGSGFEEYYQNSKLPPVQRLQQLGALQDRVKRSGLQENQRAEIAEVLDKIAANVEAKNRIFESIDKKPVSGVEKTQLILKLMTAGTFTTPRMTTKARQMLASYIGQPGFLTGYIAQAPDREEAVSGLLDSLSKAGLSQATLKTIAA
ncbi:hypothetical protein FHS83_001578 [Rhizomicrobium palustre]|uniref:Uncharacterized protein n=1 Tax=Rhizomicrobium palustre TaxID=189966 RepID=A0A846MZ81_9PROT|nr:hypothetical protein [Rhizomicrobium palustre]NIK88260.1 hypothetical protein [Rhizomicrobium palustre]